VPGLPEGLVHIECLGSVTQLVGLERAQQRAHLVVGEACEAEVDVGCQLQVGKEPRQQLVVPGAADAVEAKRQDGRLLLGDIQQDDGHHGDALGAGSDHTLVATDDAMVRESGHHGLDEAVGPDAAPQAGLLRLAHPPRVQGVGEQPVERQVLDDEFGCIH